MKISYAICVCDEHRELRDLLNFLTKVKDHEDEINILVDSSKETKELTDVLNNFKDCVINRRHFCGNFSEHRNYHNTLCKGDYIFVIDADEMPRENLINNIKSIILESNSDIISVPRINICPGYTEKWLSKHNFKVNNIGFINWPDYQTRIYKNNSNIKWEKGIHEKIVGSEKNVGLKAIPDFALWHIKSVIKQDIQHEFYNELAL